MFASNVFKHDYFMVPQNQRAEFRMVTKNKHGVEETKSLSNSDLVYLNEYFYLF